MPALNLLIKPSSGMCNLNCTYCFYHDLMSKREIPSYGFMSGEIRETLIKKALDYAAGQCSFGFQGGEPTMIGLEFYKEFVELVKQYNHTDQRIPAVSGMGKVPGKASFPYRDIPGRHHTHP